METFNCSEIFNYTDFIIGIFNHKRYRNKAQLLKKFKFGKTKETGTKLSTTNGGGWKILPTRMLALLPFPVLHAKHIP